MQKVFAKKLKDNIFSFYDDDIYHLLKVLRINIGDKIICIYDSEKFLCKICNLHPLLAKIDSKINNLDQQYQIDLFQAIIKTKPFEFVFKKSIELNTNSFFPVLFQRSQKNLVNDLRLNSLSKVCSSQSNRDELMKINNVINFNDLITILKNNHYDLVIIPYENQKNHYLTMADFTEKEISKLALIIGPEGGFTIDEIKELSKINNVKLISLTKTILRSETATIYALSIINNFLLTKGK